MTEHQTIKAATLPSRPLEYEPSLFLVEEGASYSGAEILALAAEIRQAIPTTTSATVAVCSSSAAFVLAGALAAWSRHLEPLFLDPNLKTEAHTVLADEPDLAVMVDAQGSALPNAVVVGRGGAPGFEPVWPEGQAIAAKFFTSGSTGEPKVVVKRSYQLFRQMEQELSWLGVHEGLKVFAMVPPFHILGFVYGLFLPLIGRGSTAFLHGGSPTAWIKHIHEVRPAAVIGVPSHYRFLVNSLEGPLPEARYFSSGAPLSEEIDRSFGERAGQEITQIYGSTETGGVAYRSGFGPWQAFPGLQWAVRPEDGRLMVFSAWQEDPDTWTLTDDIAKADYDRSFVLLGRADSVVKVGGKRFSTNEMVQVLSSVPEVESAVPVTYQRFGENAVALFVTAAAGCTPTAAELRSVLASRLAPFKVPRTIRVLPEMPYLASGKVDRQKLRRQAMDEDGGGSE